MMMRDSCVVNMGNNVFGNTHEMYSSLAGHFIGSIKKEYGKGCKHVLNLECT